MTKIALSMIAAVLIAGVTPGFAATSDCGTGYKDFVAGCPPTVTR